MPAALISNSLKLTEVTAVTMISGTSQKLKLMYLAKIFQEETDENHALSVYDMEKKLAAYGISSNRKTLAEDIALLVEYGMDIITERCGKANHYYLGSREFQLPELKLLADAVSSARFITEKKSRELIKKLESLAGNFSGREINRRVYVANRVKSENEYIYINVDVIQRAIDCGKKIRFKHFDYTVSKKRKYRDSGRVCSPYALTWNDGNYYMIAYYEKYGDTLSNFRVDRMENVTMLEEDAVPVSESFDLPKYMNTTFSMFSGTETDVKLRFDNSMANAVVDKFGTDVIMIPSDDNRFTVNVKIKPGNAFYGWMFQFGPLAEIVSPPALRNKFRSMLSEVSQMYMNEGDE